MTSTIRKILDPLIEKLVTTVIELIDKVCSSDKTTVELFCQESRLYNGTKELIQSWLIFVLFSSQYFYSQVYLALGGKEPLKDSSHVKSSKKIVEKMFADTFLPNAL